MLDSNAMRRFWCWHCFWGWNLPLWSGCLLAALLIFFFDSSNHAMYLLPALAAFFFTRWGEDGER